MKKKIIYFLHVLVWLILLSSDVYAMTAKADPYVLKSVAASGLPRIWFYFIFSTGYLLVLMLAFYGMYWWVGPAVFILKKPLKAVGLVLLVLVLMVAVRWGIEFCILLPVLKFHNYFGRMPGWWAYSENCILYSYKYCLFGLIAYFIVTSQRIERERRDAERERIHAELSFLRSQINPHFLFNTINDIYTLAYQKSDHAPEALLKLSGILRYMLYDGARELVPLEKELEYMDDYISLQRIGLKDHLWIEVVREGEPAGMQIAPLLLIPFVENIFKHGVVDDPKRPARLRISARDQTMTLECSNEIRRQEKDPVRGIGLSNVERRLQLLYPGRHSFMASDDGKIFHCQVRIDLYKL